MNWMNVAVCIIAFFAGAVVTFLILKAKFFALNNRVNHLENEMLLNHKEILLLQKRNAELKSEKENIGKQLTSKLLQSNDLRIE